MKMPMPVVAFVCLLSWVGAAATSEAEHEGLNFELDKEWKPVSSGGGNGVVIIEYVREGDYIKSWKELFTYENGGLRQNQHSPEEELNKIKALREKECPGATDWNVIENSESAILYEWRAKPCRGWLDQHEIAKLIYGKRNWYMVHYVAKVPELAPETRAQWIKKFEDVTVGSNPTALDTDRGGGNVEVVIPFEIDKVMAALNSAMESEDCKVTEATAGRIECKRRRGYSYSEHMGYGGESVTALVEATGDQTQIHITTGKGFYGRLGKVNCSTAVYQKMMENLHTAQP